MDLYENIFKRKSTRMFNMDSLNAESLRRVENIIDQAPNLFENIHVNYAIVKDGKDFSDSASGVINSYAKVTAPHYLVAYLRLDPGFRQAVGYSLAHVVLALNELGIGTCICFPHVDRASVLKFVEMNEEEEAVIFIAFGNPDKPEELYATPSYYKRRNLNDIILQGPIKRKHKYIFEAARLAPSSFNTQPWRFIMDGNKIHVMRVKLGFIKNKFFSSLNKIDMGIALGFMIIAIKAKGMKFKLLKDSYSFKDVEYMVTIELLD